MSRAPPQFIPAHLGSMIIISSLRLTALLSISHYPVIFHYSSIASLMYLRSCPTAVVPQLENRQSNSLVILIDLPLYTRSLSPEFLSRSCIDSTFELFRTDFGTTLPELDTSMPERYRTLSRTLDLPRMLFRI